MRQDQHKTRAELIAELERLRDRVAQLEDTRRAADQWLAQDLILGSIDDVVIATDADLSIRLWNRTAEAIYGWSADQAIGQRLTAIVTPHDPSDQSGQAAIEQLQRHGFWRGKSVHRTRTGCPITVDSSAHAIAGADGARLGYVVISRDITQRATVEQELRVSEARYRLLFENNPMPMWIYDTETLAFLAVNGAAIEHYGYSHGEFLQMKILDIRPTEQVPLLTVHLARPPARKRTISTGWQHRKKDGALIDVDVISYQLIFDDRPAKLVLINDVTDRRRAEQALEGQRYFFELLASGVPLDVVIEVLVSKVETQIAGGLCSVLLLDDTGRYVYHCSAPSLPQSYITAINGIEIGPMVGSCGAAAFLGETIVTEDIAADPRWVNYSDLALRHGLRACWSVPFRDSHGRVLGTFAIYYQQPRVPSDEELDEIKTAAYLASVAVERKRADEALSSSEQRYRGLAESMPLVLWTARPDGQIDYCNRRWYDYTGLSFEQIRSYGWPAALHPDDRAPYLARWAVALQRGEPYDVEYRLRRADGDYRWHLGRTVPARDDHGQVMFWVGTATDIDDQKRAEAEIRRLNERLELRVAERTAQLASANHELEAFSYSVSHDLRAPLRHIDGFARLLGQHESGRLDETSARYLRIIGESARKMGQLIDDLLSFSRMSRTEMQTLPVNLSQLVEDVRQELAPALERRSISWTIGALPVVRGDPAMLRLVFVNLLSNAVKYTAPRAHGQIAISASDAADGECVMTIADNGVGFDMQYVHKLFGVFQRLHRDEEFEGTGIGLATVRRIINRHGGRVWAEGRLEQGATFHFTLTRHGQE